MIPLSNKIARKPQPITKKERLKGAALWGVQALVVPSIHPTRETPTTTQLITPSYAVIFSMVNTPAEHHAQDVGH